MISGITPRTSLISAFLIHSSVEIPYFIYPVILVLVGDDLFQDSGAFKWIGLGLLGTIASLTAGLPAPLFGYLADRYRRGAMMFYSLILGSMGSLTIGLFGGSFLGMLVGVALTGLGVCMYHPPGLSWVSTAYENPDKSYSAKYNRVMGVHGMGGTLGSSIAPLSVYALIDVIDWRQIYLFWTVPLFILAIVFWIAVGRHEDKVEFHPSPADDLVNANRVNNGYLGNNRGVLVVFAFMFAMSLAGGMISFILSPFLAEVKGFKISEAAFFIGITTLLGSVGQLLGGYLGDRYGEKVALLCAAGAQVGILAGIYVINQGLVLFGLFICLGMVTAIFMPVTNSLLAKSAARRGSAFGWFMLVEEVVWSLGPGLGGVLISMDPGEQ